MISGSVTLGAVIVSTPAIRCKESITNPYVVSALDVREIVCKTLINKIDVPGFLFRWTLNPNRGC